MITIAPLTLPEAVAAKLSQLTKSRDTSRYVNVTAHGRTWQADANSQLLLSQAITLASLGLPLTPVWRDSDNNNMPVTSINQLLVVAGAIAAQTQAAYAKSWALKAQVEAAQTVEQVDKVVW